MPDGSSETRTDMPGARLLRAAFLANAVTDAIALVPVLGVVGAWRVVPTCCLQAILLVLSVWASHAGRQVSQAPQLVP